MRKLVYLLLIIVLISWGIVLSGAMNGASAHASMYGGPSSPAANFLRGVGSAELPRSTGSHLGTESVALTFDDGPQPVFTPQVLGVLQRYGVHATFFNIGEQVQEYPAIVRQVYQSGNVVGNHSWSHAELTGLSPEEIRGEISSTSVAIQQVIGVAPTLFRAPYGATNASVESIAAQLGLTQIGWTIDTNDWQRPGVDALVSTVLTQAQDGSIILMHDGGGDRSQTVQALPQIIMGLEQRGFSFITL